MPAGLLILVAERKAIRGKAPYVVCGAAVGIAASGLLVLGQTGTGAALALAQVAACGLAGAIAGRVYHAMAGHAAGAPRSPADDHSANRSPSPRAR